MRIQVDYDDTGATRMLQRMIDLGINPSPALKEVGEDLTDSIKNRFGTQTGPDGTPWARNKESTIKRKGRDQPLTGETGTLMNQIDYQLSGNDTLEVGSPTVYAAMQQFGGTKEEFPHLWDDIPAREFVGVSGEDEEKAIDTFNNYLLDTIA